MRETAQPPLYSATIQRRGYRFIAPVTAVATSVVSPEVARVMPQTSLRAHRGDMGRFYLIFAFWNDPLTGDTRATPSVHGSMRNLSSPAFSRRFTLGGTARVYLDSEFT